MDSLTVEALAQALHDWRKTQSFAGCGWVFASVVDGETLCPCPADAAAIFALVDPTVCEVCGALADGEPGRCHRHFRAATP